MRDNSVALYMRGVPASVSILKVMPGVSNDWQHRGHWAGCFGRKKATVLHHSLTGDNM